MLWPNASPPSDVHKIVTNRLLLASLQVDFLHRDISRYMYVVNLPYYLSGMCISIETTISGEIIQ
jgi:hypothetical protein